MPDRLLNTNSSSALIRTAGFNYPLGRVPLLRRRPSVFIQNGVDDARPPTQFGPLAKSLETYAKRELTETAFVVVAAGGESTKTALFLRYAQRRGWISPG